VTGRPRADIGSRSPYSARHRAAITDEGETAGAAIVDPVFEPPMAWLAWLHVSRPHRRLGVAHALWTEATTLARAAGATSMYISATPTGSAVGFYLAHSEGRPERAVCAPAPGGACR
jgi:GNAT superfamily N-acetyltransferase